MPILGETDARMQFGWVLEGLQHAHIEVTGLNCEIKKIPSDLVLTGFSTDTRTIKPGNCFIAIKGANFNGNLYAADAVKKGAALCIVSEPPTEDPGAPCILVHDTIKAYGAIAHCNLFLAQMNDGLRKVICITGSSGKTTVKDMTAHVLAAKYNTYATVGNHNNNIGVPYTLLHMPRETEIAVIEMGMNHCHEIEELVQIAPPQIAVITNVGTAHIGNLGSQDAIFDAKMEITDAMDPHMDPLILPEDDPMLGDIWRVPYFPKQVHYVTQEGRDHAGLRAEDIIETADSTSFTVISETERAAVTLPMTGKHNVTNALLAIEAARCCGMTLSECAAALSDFRPGANRSEREKFGNLTVVRDFYNANPEAMRASLGALRTIANGAKTVAVLGNMNELGNYAQAAHKALGEFCKTHVDTAYFCGDNYADFAAGYGEGALAFPAQDALTAALLRDLPALTASPCCMLIKASRGMHMEHVYDAVAASMKQ